MINLAEIVQKLPQNKWKSLNHHEKFAFLKAHIPSSNFYKYDMELRKLTDFLTT